MKVQRAYLFSATVFYIDLIGAKHDDMMVEKVFGVFGKIKDTNLSRDLRNS